MVRTALAMILAGLALIALPSLVMDSGFETCTRTHSADVCRSLIR